MKPVPEQCAAGCGARLVSGRSLNPADLPPGHLPHHGRGLCRSCHSAARRHGKLHHYPRVSLSRAEVLETWQALRRPQFDYSVAQVAQVLGMTVPGLHWVLQRARREGDPRAVPGRNTRFPPAQQPAAVPTGWRWSDAQQFDLCTLDEGEQS